MWNLVRSCALTSFWLLGVSTGAAQTCPLDWGDTFQGTRLDGAPAVVYDMIEFDFGQGARLVAGGNFRSAGTSGAQNVAVSTPDQRWEALGDGLPGVVWCLAAFNDGAGLKLYAGGTFGLTSDAPGSGIRRWNGTTWESIGGPAGQVNDLLVWNDGTGNALYAAGSFHHADGVVVDGLAKWNGVAWTGVGGGVTGGYLNKLCLYDSAQGQRLVVAGNFVRAGNINANSIALWDGASWSAIPGMSTSIEVVGIGQYQKPGIRELWISTMDFSQPLRKWNGTTLQNVPLSGISIHRITTMSQATENSEQVLLLGGTFTTSNNLRNLVKWNGTTFSAVVTNNTAPIGAVNATAYHRFSGDAAARLMAAGSFTVCFPNTGGVGAVFTGPVAGTTPTRSTFQPMAATITTPGVRALAYGPGPEGEALYAGGYFSEAFVFPDMPWYFARWQDGQWTEPVPGIDGGVNAMVRFGNDLIVGGGFSATYPAPGTSLNYIARYDGVNWRPMPGYAALGIGFPAPVQGLFTTTEGGREHLYATIQTTPRSLAKWDGSSWTAITNLGNVQVNAVTYGDIGQGPMVYGAGSLIQSNPNQVFASGGANGWQTVAPGLRFGVGYTIGIFDLGAGAQLVGGGLVGIQPEDQPQFTFYYPVVTVRNGRWVPLGSNMSGVAYKLTMYDDEHGPALYAAGDLRIIGEPPGEPSGRHLARFNGTGWELVGGGTNGVVNALLPLPDRLLVGGHFSRAGTTIAHGVAELIPCAPCPADFDQSGGVDGSDVEAFYVAWEASEPSADVNRDGGVDGGDVEAFFLVWEAGGCG